MAIVVMIMIVVMVVVVVVVVVMIVVALAVVVLPVLARTAAAAFLDNGPATLVHDAPGERRDGDGDQYSDELLHAASVAAHRCAPYPASGIEKVVNARATETENPPLPAGSRFCAQGQS
ncbi:MAG TPA: hypothetical protein VGM39_08135 [Kofleriaceae bacterium]